ncbi:MAG: Biopterin-dependent aromatic amino acid hydroxylase, partial [Bacteroidota bacterium]|nr:Biopterin-dependent aromatic amino acid hydroxylase [Bacteroidota bacterium]
LCLNTSYRTDILQEQYFVIDSFNQLFHSLDQIKSCLSGMVNTVVVNT